MDRGSLEQDQAFFIKCATSRGNFGCFFVVLGFILWYFLKFDRSWLQLFILITFLTASLDVGIGNLQFEIRKLVLKAEERKN